MIGIDIGAFAKKAMLDPEFSREIRYFDGRIKLGVGRTDYYLEFTNGALVKADKAAIADSDCRIFIKGTEDHWNDLLQEFPRPFFQCVQSANIKHGLILSGSDVTFAYLPAINRMMSLLRTSMKEA